MNRISVKVNIVEPRDCADLLGSGAPSVPLSYSRGVEMSFPIREMGTPCCPAALGAESCAHSP